MLTANPPIEQSLCVPTEQVLLLLCVQESSIDDCVDRSCVCGIGCVGIILLLQVSAVGKHQCDDFQKTYTSKNQLASWNPVA